IAPALHVLFASSRKHDSEAVDALIKKFGYKGYLVLDAATIYDYLFPNGDIIEVGCWSHCRRYILKTLASEPTLANEALTLIAELFMIERSSRTHRRRSGRSNVTSTPNRS